MLDKKLEGKKGEFIKFTDRLEGQDQNHKAAQL
jgi:hypothetical protein